MSRVSQIVCDAPKCCQVKKETNNWWIIRSAYNGEFQCVPMHGSKDEPEDNHFCSSSCMHDMLEEWMQMSMDRITPKEVPVNYAKEEA
jgi:hypothetical protein